MFEKDCSVACALIVELSLRYRWEKAIKWKLGKQQETERKRERERWRGGGGRRLEAEEDHKEEEEQETMR